jgi:transposase
MKKTVRMKHSASFKAKVALEAVREGQSVAELARRFGIHENLVYKWKQRLLENISRVFEPELSGSGDGSEERMAELLRKIGELTVERDFLSNGLGRPR